MASAIKTKTRLKTVKSLNSIFYALQIIAISRMQKVKLKHKQAQSYLEAVREIAAQFDFKMPAGRLKKWKTLGVLISANRGFCGAFNQNLFFRFHNFVKELEGASEFMVFGKRGLDHLAARKQPVSASYLKEDYGFEFFHGMGKTLVSKYRSGEVSGIHIIFNRYQSVIRQDAVTRRLLPPESKPAPMISKYLIEPDQRSARDAVLEQLVAAELYFSYLDSLLGELSSRMVTLKGAIENSKDLIGTMTIQLNKDRQQSITQDLLEIISSSESLKEEVY